MSKKLVAVLDISSNEVNAYAVEKTDMTHFSVRASAETYYSGYRNGLFVDETTLSSAISNCMQRISAETGAIMARTYIGIPAEFSLVRTRELQKDFTSSQKVDDSMILNIMEKGDVYDGENGFITVSKNALYATLDDDRLVSDPRGRSAYSVSIMTSYCLAEKAFVKTVSNILYKIGYQNLSFVCAPYAEAVGLFSREELERAVLFADIGYRSTSLMLVRGSGLLDLASFSLGRESFLTDLAECLEIEHGDAERLLKQLNLNVPPNKNDVLFVNRDLGFYTEDVVSIVKGRVEDFAHMLKQCLDKFEYQCPIHMMLHLSGDGILGIRGAKYELEHHLGRKIDGLAPLVPNYDTPKYSIAMGLISEALKHERVSSSGVLNKLFGKR